MPTKINGSIPVPIQYIIPDDRFSVAAYNDNYYSFSSNNPLDADYCVITAEGIEYILQPDKNGIFTYNTYEFARELFVYEDGFDYASSQVDINQFKEITINIKIVLLNGQEELDALTIVFYNCVFQNWEYPFKEDGFTNLSEAKMPYFVGYPFEYSSYLTEEVTRTLVDDGSGIGLDENVRNIETNCDGVFIKFHNSKYGYSYYLFESVSKERFRTKSIGNLKEPFSWTDNYLDIGKDGQRKMEVFAYVDYNDREIIKALAKSNEIYLYTGNKGDAADETKWLKVKVDKMNIDETNKNNTFPQRVVINLPQEKTRTRI